MRAGSFDDVRPRLGRGDIMARAAGFYTLGGAPRERADNRIPPRWWEWQLRDVDPAAGRASFNMELGDRITDELLQRARYPELFRYNAVITDHVLVAIGIELERGAVEALWPGAITLMDASWPKVVAPVEALRSETSAPAPKHAGGRPLEHKWESAAKHVDRVVKNGPLLRDGDGTPDLKRARELMAEGFENDDPPAPNDEDIYKWIREHPQRCQKWWSPRHRR